MKAQEQLENAVGSKLPEKITELEAQPLAAPTGAPEVEAVPNAFTAGFTLIGHGLLRVNMADARITKFSRVLAAISEFGATPFDRFIGSARMVVYNIAPFNGGVQVLAEVFWGSDLNIRFDIFVDP